MKLYAAHFPHIPRLPERLTYVKTPRSRLSRFLEFCQISCRDEAGEIPGSLPARVAACNPAMIYAARRYNSPLMLPRKCSRLLVTCLSVAPFENGMCGEPQSEGTESSCRITTGLYDDGTTPSARPSRIRFNRGEALGVTEVCLLLADFRLSGVRARAQTVLARRIKRS